MPRENITWNAPCAKAGTTSRRRIAEAPGAGGVEEVLPACNKHRPHKDRSSDDGRARQPEAELPAGFWGFLRDVRSELRRSVADVDELKRRRAVIIVLAPALGIFIGLLDSFLRLVFRELVAKLFGFCTRCIP